MVGPHLSLKEGRHKAMCRIVRAKMKRITDSAVTFVFIEWVRRRDPMIPTTQMLVAAHVLRGLSLEERFRASGAVLLMFGNNHAFRCVTDSTDSFCLASPTNPERLNRRADAPRSPIGRFNARCISHGAFLHQERNCRYATNEPVEIYAQDEKAVGKSCLVYGAGAFANPNARQEGKGLQDMAKSLTG